MEQPLNSDSLETEEELRQALKDRQERIEELERLVEEKNRRIEELSSQLDKYRSVMNVPRFDARQPKGGVAVRKERGWGVSSEPVQTLEELSKTTFQKYPKPQR